MNIDTVFISILSYAVTPLTPTTPNSLIWCRLPSGEATPTIAALDIMVARFLSLPINEYSASRLDREAYRNDNRADG